MNEPPSEYHRLEPLGAPLRITMTFMCQQELAVYLKTCGLVEGVSAGAVIRRLLHKAAKQEGYQA